MEFAQVSEESVRARLQEMSDAQLKRFGAAAAYMCTPEANLGKPPREDFLIQLREARAEWSRRKASQAAAGSGVEANASRTAAGRRNVATSV